MPHALIFGHVKVRVSKADAWLEEHGYLERRGEWAHDGPTSNTAPAAPNSRSVRAGARAGGGRCQLENPSPTWVGCTSASARTGSSSGIWVGRFELKRDRDAAVTKAKVEKPWLKDATGTPITVDEWADRYLARMESGALLTKGGRRYKHSSIDTAQSALRALREAFGNRPLGSITRVEAEDWAASVTPGKIQPAVTLMNEAYRAELIDRNRFEGLGRRVEGRRNEPPPSEDEMLLLLDGCAALGDYAPMIRALITFAAFTLMRPGELFALDWEDIDLDAGRVYVNKRLYRGRTDLPKSNVSGRSR
jgi:hypothetical protein